MPGPQSKSPRRHLIWVGLCCLVAGVIWVRLPTFGFEVWNVDEAIHAAIARTILHGGVLYHDAIDQRNPLTYYAVALLFHLTGENNVWAMHALATALIIATTLGLFFVGRRMGGSATGAWAALLFGVLSTTLLYPGDAYALNTEWFVAAFTTWAAWFFWSDSKSSPPGWVRLGFAGVCLSLAFLSKQPALLDLAPLLIVLVYLAVLDATQRSLLPTRIGAILAGFLLPLLVTCIYLVIRGAFTDFIFYAWQYNMHYYAPEVSTGDRLLSSLKPFLLLGQGYPLVLVALLGAFAYSLFRCVQLRPTNAEKSSNPAWLFMLCWSLTSLAGSTSGGRGYDHYYIQFLPAGCLGAAMALNGLGQWLHSMRLRWLNWFPTLLITGCIGLNLSHGLILGRQHAHLPVDSSWRTAKFVAAHTGPSDKIFVWGYQPDIYLFSNRLPASRFVYCSFLTGLIPWTNTAPEKDTSYAIVPGAMDTLLHDLRLSLPACIVDCSVGPNRSWDKYPLHKFPALEAFITQNYVLAEPNQFGAQGYHVYLITDSARRHPYPLAGGKPDAQLDMPQLFIPPDVENHPTAILFAGSSPTGDLQRLELLRNGKVETAVSFPPSNGILFRTMVSFDHLGKAPQIFSVRAIASSGKSTTSPERTVVLGAASLSPDELPQFGLPHQAKPIVPILIRAPYGASADFHDGVMHFYVHAPSSLVYSLTNDAVSLRGSFGIRAGAYAPTNSSPTDGAEFRIDWVKPDGSRLNLFHRLLQPAKFTADRGPQPFDLKLPAPENGRLELTINNGPLGNASSDWTYWSGLLLESSR